MEKEQDKSDDRDYNMPKKGNNKERREEFDGGEESRSLQIWDRERTMKKISKRVRLIRTLHLIQQYDSSERKRDHCGWRTNGLKK